MDTQSNGLGAGLFGYPIASCLLWGYSTLERGQERQRGTRRGGSGLLCAKPLHRAGTYTPLPGGRSCGGPTIKPYQEARILLRTPVYPDSGDPHSDPCERTAGLDKCQSCEEGEPNT